MRAEGMCRPGGPLEVAHVPLPEGVVTHQPPKVLTPKPLPALPHGTRGYIRAWAVSNGFRVAPIGALPKTVLTAYARRVPAH